MHIKKKGFAETKIESEFYSLTSDNTYSVYGVRQQQTAFCFLPLGYVLAVACFLNEFIWYRLGPRNVNKLVLFHVSDRHK